jgi:hypothetical protein
MYTEFILEKKRSGISGTLELFDCRELADRSHLGYNFPQIILHPYPKY